MEDTGRVRQIRAHIEGTTSDYDHGKLQELLTKTVQKKGGSNPVTITTRWEGKLDTIGSIKWVLQDFHLFKEFFGWP